MSEPAWRLAPAKLNLGLRVVGRRDDGYHLLESLFVPLELADRVRVEAEPAAVTSISVTMLGRAGDVPAGDDNLVTRAARAFLGAAGITARIALTLDKQIPVGAGLGGGSSDAAAVLCALAQQFANELSIQALAAVAVRLGADVPFFLDPRPAWVTGIGEQIEPIREFPALDVLLATPAPPLATADVFRALDAALTPPSPRRRMPALRDGPGWFPSAALLSNDLEPVVARLRPGIARIRSELERLGARAVAMSGSGPTMFGLFRDAGQAEAASKEGRFKATDRVQVTRSHDAPGSVPRGGKPWGVV
ncbi:MAG: 4-(cytidine 5-diphospho)-2-C-methyl-D-erythritol kinase [Deltaproteobacteria bacterium]|nr:4-(cytidine 5-diphospho)-2-C-methyl-D-erythritol kinase [Deltaproteobacteria bacterium]